MLFRDSGGGLEIQSFRRDVDAWIDDPSVPRDAILDAIVRVWHGILSPGRSTPEGQ
jgi:hypothetical protein